MSVTTKPRIAITIGDAAGIGPEIVLKSISNPELTTKFNCTIIGDAAHLRSVASRLGLDEKVFENVNIEDLDNLPTKFKIGVDAPEIGRASAEYIVRAVELWKNGKIDALATAPISKRAIRLGGYDFPGHTEFLANLTDTNQFAMSFFAGNLRVSLLSTHLPLRDAIGMVKRDALVDLIMFTSSNMNRLLRREAKIAVAGLNPHASEGGLFGFEETEEIIPAIEHCIRSGINVTGPYSADTIFYRCAKGEFDVVVALYHDQATIPVKSLAFNSGVNVTLGLPLVRTSVDHGTAFDIAGRGIADPSSMSAAISLAGELSSPV